MPAFANRTPADACPFRRAKLSLRPVAPQVDLAAWRVEQARSVVDHAEAEYADACRWLGEANRRLSPKHRGSGVWSVEIRKAWVRSAFRDINRKRAALRAARKALAALEAV